MEKKFLQGQGWGQCCSRILGGALGGSFTKPGPSCRFVDWTVLWGFPYAQRRPGGLWTKSRFVYATCPAKEHQSEAKMGRFFVKAETEERMRQFQRTIQEEAQVAAHRRVASRWAMYVNVSVLSATSSK